MFVQLKSMLPIGEPLPRLGPFDATLQLFIDFYGDADAIV